MRRAFFFFASLWILACGDSFLAETDPGTTAGAGGSGASSSNGGSGAGSSNGGNSSTGGGGGCNGGVVVPPLPAGWNDYLIVAKQPPGGTTCPEGPEHWSGQNLMAPSDCDCGCHILTESCRAAVGAYSDDGCTTAMGVDTLFPPGCSIATNWAINTHATWATTTDGSLCGGDSPSPAAVRYDSFLSCDITASEGCLDDPGGPFESAVCVWQAGLQACPADFPVSHEVFTNVNDQRACNADCECTNQDIECHGQLGSYSDAVCNDFVAALAEEQCAEVTQVVGSVQYVPSPTGTCAQTSGSVTGSAVEAGWETICCTDS